MNKFTYKKLPPFKWFILENFPFIEADFDALTNWELFCKLGNEIRKIIDSENSLGIQMENLTKAFNELETYVNNYFENLDIQTEVNNKLDEMAESGELEEIIEQYLQLNSINFFDTVSDMLDAENLTNGSICETLGFYNVNDGGGARYKIREILNTDVINNYSLFALTNSNTLIAELYLPDEKINISQLGINNDNDTILKYAVTNFGVVEIDSDLSIADAITIESTDRVTDIVSKSLKTITCAQGGFILQKARVNFISVKLENSAVQSETIANTYTGILLNASRCVIDNCRVTNFYRGIWLPNTMTILWTKIIRTTCGYNKHSGICIEALQTPQKNAIIVENCYLNRNGTDADDNTSNGTDGIGYGLFISGGYAITLIANVYEYNTNCGLYIENGYGLKSLLDLNGYYEQNKRCQIYLAQIDNMREVRIENHFSNRPYANVSNVYAQTDVMFTATSLYNIYNPQRNNLFFGYDNFKDMFTNFSDLFACNNLSKFVTSGLNECFTQKPLNANNKLYIKNGVNYQYLFPLVENAKYKLRIKFASGVSNPNFGFVPYGDTAHPMIAIQGHTLTNNWYEVDFTSNTSDRGYFYGASGVNYEIEYMSLTKTG